MTLNKKDNYKSALIVTICIFFFWGFAASGNALLIPVLKEKFSLSQFESQMVELSFYLAYFFGSLIYFLVSVKRPEWLEKFSVKQLMVSGLITSASGTIALVITSNFNSYLLLLLSLFIIAFGFALQQIVANPLLIKLGGELYGAQRLILAGAVNSFGNSIAPLVISFFVFGAISAANIEPSISSLAPLFILITSLYLVLAFWFYKVNLPEREEPSGEKISGLGALRYPQLISGMVAILCYVGCEVSLQSNLPALVASKNIMNLPAKDAIHYFSLFGGSLMIGRWTGAVFNFKTSKVRRNILLFIAPLLAFSLVLFSNWLIGSDLLQLLDYFPFLFIISVILLITGNYPAKMLQYASLISIVLLICSVVTSGKLSMFCVIAVANFSALMWPCIFMLSIKGLGKYTQQGSSLLVMMILGGAIVPPLQGLLSDFDIIGIQKSFLLPALGFSYILIFAIQESRRAKLHAQKS